MKQILVLVVVLMCVGSARPQDTKSQRVIYTSSNPPTVCAPGKIYSNATTHKVYQGSSISGCTDVTGGAAGITNSAGNNVIPKSDGTNIVASNITDDGTTVALAKKVAVTPASDGATTLLVNDTTGTQRVAFGTLPGLTTYGAMWMGANTPTASNYVLARTNDSDTALNAAATKNITLTINDTTGWRINSSGFLQSLTNNALDIGANGANSPRTIYAATSFIGPTATLTALASDAASTNNTVCVTAATGVLTKGSGTLGICLGTSSAKYKHDIRPMGHALNEVLRLRPKRFFYNDGYGDSGARENLGFIAEDVARQVPELARMDAVGQPLSVDILGMVPKLVQAVQELNAKVESLNVQVRAQRKTIRRLRLRK